MNFCNNCGARVERLIPPGDNLPRFVCARCGTIHYENPKIVVGCIPEWEKGILLCRRAIEPRHGLWTVPAGFMENGETTAQGALRETLEEANARVEMLGLYALFNIPHINQVYMLFRARPARSRFPRRRRNAGSTAVRPKMKSPGTHSLSPPCGVRCSTISAIAGPGNSVFTWERSSQWRSRRLRR